MKNPGVAGIFHLQKVYFVLLYSIFSLMNFHFFKANARSSQPAANRQRQAAREF